MNTTSWTDAPTCYLAGWGSAMRPSDVLHEAVIGVQPDTAVPLGSHTTATITRFNAITLGIPSSRRPLS
jgi:hypothetical protein